MLSQDHSAGNGEICRIPGLSLGESSITSSNTFGSLTSSVSMGISMVILLGTRSIFPRISKMKSTTASVSMDTSDDVRLMLWVLETGVLGVEDGESIVGQMTLGEALADLTGDNG